MLGGIVFQMAAIAVYVFCAAEFFYRYYSDRPVRSGADGGQLPAGAPIGKHLRTMIMALGFNTICIFIRYVACLHSVGSQTHKIYDTRSVYRTIELADGWDGRIIGTQVYFSTSSPLCLLPHLHALIDSNRRFGWRHDHTRHFHSELLPPRTSSNREVIHNPRRRI